MEKASGDREIVKVRHLVFTWSNLISASRILVAIPIIWLHYINDLQVTWPVWVLVFYGVLSDYLDGLVARLTDRVSELGKNLDPVADKITAFLLFAYAVWIAYIPVWFFVLAVARDLLIVSGSAYIHYLRGKVAMAVTTGKFSVFSLSVYWISVFFFPEATPIHYFFMGTSTSLMVFSFFDYLQRFTEIKHGAEFN